MNERLIELETRCAHQEELLDKLNASVGDQQLQLNKLQSSLKLLLVKFSNLEPDNIKNSGEQELPPHY